MTAATPSLARIGDYARWYAQRTPDAEALVHGDSRISYRDLDERVDALARALLAAGVRKGDRVATLSAPHPDYFIALLASTSIGALWVGLNPRYRADEIGYVIGDCEPTVLLVRMDRHPPAHYAEIVRMRANISALQHIVALDGEQSDAIANGEVECRAAFLGRGADVSTSELAAARAACGARDPCLIVYTSGSTGKPKGALLCNQGLVEFGLAQNRVWPLSRVRVLNYFPINHVGCVVDISCPALVAGGCIVFLEKFEPAASLRLMAAERITFWGSVPSVFNMQLALPDFRSFDLTSVELIVWEGAAMPVEMIRRLTAICPRLATNYGMTETTSGVTFVAPTSEVDVLANTVGSAFEGVEIRLVTPDGTIAKEGEPGEIQTRSIYNMLGYWRRAPETASALLADGWLRTGDVGLQRSDGRYQIVGRLKEMYKSGGYNVYPRETEQVIESHPAVALAAVVSVADPLWQEVGVAFVVPRSPITVEEIEAHCRARLANYKTPKRFLIRSELPLLPIGKVDKATLRAQAAAAERAD